LSLLVAGCKSTPAPEEQPDPFLFIGDHDLYFHFPVKGNESIAEQFMERYIPDISRKSKQQILSRITRLYGGYGPGSGDIELVVFGSIPKSALKSSLTKKNGWIPVQKNIIYRHSATGIEIHLGGTPTNTPGALLLAFDAEEMSTRSISRSNEEWELPKDAPEWMRGAVSDADIQFYLPSALTMLPSELKSALAVVPMAKEASASGVLAKAQKKRDYTLSLDVDFHNERMTAILVPLLMGAIEGFIQLDVTMGIGGHIILSGITLDENAIQNILK
jgi:hypothetical protein